MNYFRNLWSAIKGKKCCNCRPRNCKLTSFDIERIKFLHADGNTNALIGRELGIKPARVSAVLKRQERLK